MMLIPFHIFRLLFFFFFFSFFKKIQIIYEGITNSGVKRELIILENTSALGNFHNLDLQVPKHPRTRLSLLSCSLKSPWPSHSSSPHLEPHRSRGHQHPHGDASGAQGLPAICESTESQDSQGMENFLVSPFQRKQGVKAVTKRAVVFT